MTLSPSLRSQGCNYCPGCRCWLSLQKQSRGKTSWRTQNYPSHKQSRTESEVLDHVHNKLRHCSQDTLESVHLSIVSSQPAQTINQLLDGRNVFSTYSAASAIKWTDTEEEDLSGMSAWKSQSLSMPPLAVSAVCRSSVSSAQECIKFNEARHHFSSHDTSLGCKRHLTYHRGHSRRRGASLAGRRGSSWLPSS